jgi:hypothetical protein
MELSITGSAGLPATQDAILRNMQAAVPARRTGGAGVVYARLSRETGALTYGRDETPLPLDHDYTVPGARSCGVGSRSAARRSSTVS